MLILSDVDKYNISHMAEDCFRYAGFPKNWGTKDKRKNWMELKTKEKYNDYK